jgi:hypothetical protein
MLLTDPDPAGGRPPPAASAASYAHATGASYEPASATAASAPAAASATGGRESYALAELGFVFFVEDIKCPQSDVRNFLLIEPDFGMRYVV